MIVRMVIDNNVSNAKGLILLFLKLKMQRKIVYLFGELEHIV